MSGALLASEAVHFELPGGQWPMGVQLVIVGVVLAVISVAPKRVKVLAAAAGFAGFAAIMARAGELGTSQLMGIVVVGAVLATFTVTRGWMVLAGAALGGFAGAMLDPSTAPGAANAWADHALPSTLLGAAVGAVLGLVLALIGSGATTRLPESEPAPQGRGRR